MDNLEEYVQDLMRLFEMDLFNKVEKLEDKVVVTMLDGSKVNVLAKLYN